MNIETNLSSIIHTWIAYKYLEKIMCQCGSHIKNAPANIAQHEKTIKHTKYMKESNRDLRLESEMQTKLPQELRIELLKSAYFEINNYF